MTRKKQTETILLFLGCCYWIWYWLNKKTRQKEKKIGKLRATYKISKEVAIASNNYI